MFAHGIDKTRHQDLLRQTFHIQERFEATLSRHLLPSETTRRSLVHGVATLAIGGNVQHMRLIAVEGVGGV